MTQSNGSMPKVWGARKDERFAPSANLAPRRIIATCADGEFCYHGRADGSAFKLRDSGAARNRRFDKMAKRGDTKFSSRGSGVAYSPRLTTQREVDAMVLGRVADDLAASARKAYLFRDATAEIVQPSERTLRHRARQAKRG